MEQKICDRCGKVREEYSLRGIKSVNIRDCYNVKHDFGEGLFRVDLCKKCRRKLYKRIKKTIKNFINENE